jgi:tetratricopeptide (TPR) repeat protein
MASAPSGYTLKDAARLLELSIREIQTLIRAGLIEPARGPRGEIRLCFQDLVVLRSAAQLLDRVPPGRLRKALARLKRRPGGLQGVRLTAEGRFVVAHDGHMSWDPESGQAWLDFGTTADRGDSGETASVYAICRPGFGKPSPLTPDAEDFYMRGCELESADPSAAGDAYRRAIDIDPDHVDARINLGRLLHEAGDLPGAEAQYRSALESSPDDSTAAFNLGVLLEDQMKPLAAINAYKLAIAADPNHADAHYNLSHLYESMGNRRNALRHLDIYRKLMRGA